MYDKIHYKKKKKNSQYVFLCPHLIKGARDLCEVSYEYIFEIFIYLVVLHLCCCIWAFSSCSEWGLLFVVLHRLHIEVAFLVAEHRL